jgi:hypothetical protein
MVDVGERFRHASKPKGTCFSGTYLSIKGEGAKSTAVIDEVRQSGLHLRNHLQSDVRVQNRQRSP